jgi:hypothetical protein
LPTPSFVSDIHDFKGATLFVSFLVL